MKFLLQIIQTFLDGFVPVFVLLVMWGGVYYVYTRTPDELAGMPLLRELTDTYKQGWQETLRLGNCLAAHVVTIRQPALAGTPNQASNIAGTKPDEELVIGVAWERAAIEKKLKDRGWSKGKLKAAGTYLSYIDRYLDEAVRDMYFNDVSASITLAQGILESDAGRSGLATKTNNHFGIKARPNGEGRRKLKARLFTQLTDLDFSYRSPAIGVSQHHDDFAHDRFEVYPSVLDSYQRHSDLLRNTCSTARKGCYGWIWTAFPVQEERLDITEMARRFEGVSGYAPKDFFGETVVPYYAAQAAGLKMAGYATSKTYHEKLVYLIETYELWRLDIALARAMQMQQ
jgi:hypothetical protein